MQPSGIITLTTDFGVSDPYVGGLKGVILTINPRCRMVDITHQIAPQDVMAGSFTLSISYRFFPPGTIHLAVVDPGVGTNRRPLLVKAGDYFFIGPDNGIFSFILSGSAEVAVHAITEPAFWLPEPSRTFHGRDIFAPVAAHLAGGVAPSQFGPPVDDYIVYRLPEPEKLGSSGVSGEIIHTDHFGNLITNIPESLVRSMTAAGCLQAEIRGAAITRLLPAYGCADEDELFCIIGSSGLLEVALKNGSAQQRLAARRGDRIIIKKADA
jgi:hypothetical protein